MSAAFFLVLGTPSALGGCFRLRNFPLSRAATASPTPTVFDNPPEGYPAAHKVLHE